MSRLSELSTETMTEDQSRVYNQTRTGWTAGPLRGPSSAWIRSPEMYERLGWMVMFMRNDSVIPARLVEFVILLTVGHMEVGISLGRPRGDGERSGFGG